MQRVAHVWSPCIRCCNMLDGVGSGLEMVNFLLQHFWVLQDVVRVRPASLKYLKTQFNDVGRCCVEMLRAF